jgi:uncharacterized protein HemX
MSQDNKPEQEYKPSGRVEVSKDPPPTISAKIDEIENGTPISQQSLISRLVIAILLLIIIGIMTVVFLLKQPGDWKEKYDSLKSADEQIVTLETEIGKKYNAINKIADNINKETKIWKELDSQASELRSQLDRLVKSK